MESYSDISEQDSTEPMARDKDYQTILFDCLTLFCHQTGDLQVNCHRNMNNLLG